MANIKRILISTGCDELEIAQGRTGHSIDGHCMGDGAKKFSMGRASVAGLMSRGIMHEYERSRCSKRL